MPLIGYAALYMFVELGALVLASALFAAVTGVILIGGGVLLACVMYSTSLHRAVKSGDPVWVLDHFLAPSLATFAAIFAYYPLHSIDVTIQNLANSLEGSASIFGPLLVLAIACTLGSFAIFGAPYLAITMMGDEDRFVRLASYFGWIATATWWGVIIVGTTMHRPL